MTRKELFYFIGKCLMLDEDPEFRQVIIEKNATNAIDWLRFVAHGSNHLILPSIYLQFQSHGIMGYLPEELSEFLKEVYDLNLSRNTLILEQLQNITGVLNQENICPVFLKGAGNLLDEVYKDIGARILNDIDFLVPEKDWLRSIALLEIDGYSMIGKVYGDIGILKHYPRIAKPGTVAVIEIHRLPVSSRHQSWFNPCIIDLEKKKVTTLTGCFVLSDKHKIILNFVHRQLDHGDYAKGLVSFRDLYDLYLLSKRFSIKRTMTGIKIKRKAIAYFAFAGKAFGLNERFYSGSNFATWSFLKIHDLNLSSVRFYYIYRSILFISQRIFIGYIGQIIKSFYSKGVRRSVINRLSDRRWYRAHLDSYICFFSPNHQS